MRAAWEGHFNVCRLLIQHGADPMIEDFNGKNALCRAVEGGQEKICDFLLEKKHGSIEHRTRTGRSLLHLAIEMENKSMCKYLINLGADINYQNEDLSVPPPLYYATVQGKVSVIEALLEYKTKIEIEKTYCYETALYAAARKGQLIPVKKLFEYGANLNHTLPGYRSILSGAAEGRHRYIAGYLIDHGACIDQQFELHLLYAFFLMAANDAVAARHDKFAKDRWIGVC